MKLYDNPAFSHIDPRLVIHLQHMIDSSAKKNNAYDTLQGLLKVSNELTTNQIPCTPEMQKALIDCFKDTLPMSQRKQFDTFFKMMSKMKQ